MTITEIISQIDNFADDVVIYAKKEAGKFTESSDVCLIDLKEDELELSNREIAQKYCIGFDYFLEVFIVKEILSNLSIRGYVEINQNVLQIIHYAEFDA